MGTKQLFLQNALIVSTAAADARTAAAWDQPSVLEEQTVGSLVAHLARGSVSIVLERLDAGSPSGPPTLQSAAHFFSNIAPILTPEAHANIRSGSEQLASVGHDELTHQLTDHLSELRRRLADEPADRFIPVYDDNVIRLDDYLETRILEQVVHLDDLARSLDVEPWACATGAQSVAIRCGAEIGERRYGATNMIRTLFRNDDPTLSVL